MNQRTTYTVEEALSALQKYCAYQERCHKEVRDKLWGMHMIPQAIDVIVSQLIADNFLNETRFAKAFVQGKFRIKKWGKQRLKNELKQRDISTYNINIALKQIDDLEYYDTLNSLAQKRFLAIKEPNVWKKRKKLADYLLYRGWESHLVYEKVKELIP
ncbi:recombinase RecX [Mangrovimonas yunxiaonensis]|uniref:Regulatory protein RecX n=1 Tax=Mangrovimonas yunxiaonensis TaxID=1197477 RepID=A0A084TL17_9FLAO|nr:regulatory protein RecX [Mangrovimonas yunxiaonensis]KFB01403.1 recombinase RecX [Mangrovimonas yunxiaonensis]GGH36848.1 recombinase RecX [Mangrovimonas yunxiaonensis]